MINLSQIKEYDGMHLIPLSIHINKGVILDTQLLRALVNPTNKDYTYDFRVYLPKYKCDLQRNYVWEYCQQNEFILSLLFSKPIQPIIVVQHSFESKLKDPTKTVNYVIDGKQRLLTIIKFVHNEFAIKINGNLIYYRDFDDSLKTYFKFKVNDLIGWIYYSYPDTPVTDDMKIILFNYYNFSGTPQTEEHKRKLQSLLTHVTA